MLLLAFAIFTQVEYKIYTFDAGYLEFWYYINMTDDLQIIKGNATNADSFFITYSYNLTVRNDEGTDSGTVAGTKGTGIGHDQMELHLTDCVPIYLYQGDFTYRIDISSDFWQYSDNGMVVIRNTTDTVGCSDLVIAKLCPPNTFIYHNYNIMPSIDRCFSLLDTMVSYVELYNLRPDSLNYLAKYTILNNTELPIIALEQKRIKHDYHQIDTSHIPLLSLVQGEYTLQVEILDSVSGLHSVLREPFSVIVLTDDYEGKPFYADIHYLVDNREYKAFQKLDEQGQRLYLKEFWSKRSYPDYEKQIRQADSLFSNQKLMGRNSERGRYYIKYGPPNEIEHYTMTWWGRDIELWRYQGKGVEIVFCDTHDDANPRFIVELRIGEMMHILEFGYRDSETKRKWPWLYDLAPGTYNTLDIPEE